MKTPNSNFRQRLLAARRRGASLMEVAASMLVMAVLFVVLMNLQQAETDRISAKNSADKLATIGAAAKGYISANYANLLASAPTSGAQVIPVGRTTAGGAVPAGSLQAAGFLPVSFIDTNTFQQNTVLLVRKVNSTTLDAMLTTYGGRQIPDRMLGSVAKSIGPSGGFVPSVYPQSSDAGNVLGVGGGWRTATSTWGAAATRPSTGTIQMTMNFEDGSVLKDFLYRNDVGNPEANRMNTNIDMNSNALNNTGKITGVADAVTGGTAVVIGDASNPNTLRATRDIWADRDVKAARDVVANNNVSAGNDVAAGRDMTAARDITSVRDIKSGRDLTAARNLIVEGTGRIKGDATMDGNARVMKNVTIDGDLKAGRLNMDTVVFGTDTDGKKRAIPADVTLGDMLPRMVAQYSYVVKDGETVYKPVCRGGFTKARIMVYKQVDSAQMSVASGATTVQYMSGVTVEDRTSSTWRVRWVGNPKATNSERQAIAQTFCFYG